MSKPPSALYVSASFRDTSNHLKRDLHVISSTHIAQKLSLTLLNILSPPLHPLPKRQPPRPHRLLALRSHKQYSLRPPPNRRPRPCGPHDPKIADPPRRRGPRVYRKTHPPLYNTENTILHPHMPPYPPLDLGDAISRTFAVCHTHQNARIWQTLGQK